MASIESVESPEVVQAGMGEVLTGAALLAVVGFLVFIGIKAIFFPSGLGKKD